MNTNKQNDKGRIPDVKHTFSGVELAGWFQYNEQGKIVNRSWKIANSYLDRNKQEFKTTEYFSDEDLLKLYHIMGDALGDRKEVVK